MVCCGYEMRRFRAIANDAIERLNQMLRVDQSLRAVLTQWNYMLDTAGEEPAGHLADRSLRQVEASAIVVSVVGRKVPHITHQEIRHVYHLSKRGQNREFWLYVYKRPGVDDSAYGELAALVSEIETDFDITIRYRPVASTLDFQASLLTQLIPYVIRRASPAFGPLSGPTS
jgi:hypothetical protein